MVDKLFDWEALHMAGWDTERKCWCQVIDLDVLNNNVGLRTGDVAFWRNLNKTKLKLGDSVRESLPDCEEQESLLDSTLLPNQESLLDVEFLLKQEALPEQEPVLSQESDAVTDDKKDCDADAIDVTGKISFCGENPN